MTTIEPVRNRDRCGRCKTIHGGNEHSCPVHGPVSKGCCEPRCDPAEWDWVKGKGPVRIRRPTVKRDDDHDFVCRMEAECGAELPDLAADATISARAERLLALDEAGDDVLREADRARLERLTR